LKLGVHGLTITGSFSIDRRPPRLSRRLSSCRNSGSTQPRFANLVNKTLTIVCDILTRGEHCKLGNAMFDTIILLTGAVEQSALGALLCAHNSQLTVLPMKTAKDFAALDAAILRRSRLIAFSTPVIVPRPILEGLGYDAYNFHPGPPQYPGWSPAHFALYEQATEFGATAHVMTERVDSGPIIDAALFPIPPGIHVLGLEGLAYGHLAQLFWRLAKALATASEPLPELPLQWGTKKNSRRAYRAICQIPLDITKEELERRLRVFGDNHFGVAPTIQLHGWSFARWFKR
jgi:methionyl-tRNA formyltransferase